MRQIIRLLARPALALALLAGSVNTAAAQTASPAGAAALQALIQERLADAAAGGGDAVRLERVPEVAVTAQGDRYAVSIPRLRLLTQAGWLLEAPRLEAELLPQPGGGWAVEAEIPQPLSVFSDRGFRAGDLTIGKQKLKATWSADGYLIRAADIALSDVRFAPAIGGGAFRLDQFALLLEPKAAGDSGWTGLFSLVVSGLSWQDLTGVQRLAVADLRVKGDARALDLDRFALLAKAWRSGADPDPAGLDRLATGLTLNLDAKGLRELRSDGRATKLDNASGKLALTDLGGDRAGLRLNWHHDGFDRRGGDSGNPATHPATADIALAGERMPGQPLLTALVLHVLGDDAAAQQASRERLMAAMTRTGAQLVIERMDLRNATSTASGTGDFRFGPPSPRGVAGQADVTVQGLDRMIAALNQGGGAGAPGTAILLYAMQGLGRAEAEGRHRYQIQLLPDGRTLLNGADMAAISGLIPR